MENAPILVSYGLQQAIDDGVLHMLWPNRWWKLTSGKPLIVTAAVKADVSNAALIDIWNAYVTWRREVEPTLAEEDKLFSTEVNGNKVWLIEDGQAFTVLYPSDY